MRSVTAKSVGALLAAALLTWAAVGQAVVLKGRGELHARGSGLAVLDVQGKVTVTGVGLMVVDERVHLDLDGQGRVTPLGDGRLLVEGFGRAVVISPRHRTRVEIAGARIRLKARGRGVARLLGHGVFYANDVDGGWGPDVEVEFEEADEE